MTNIFRSVSYNLHKEKLLTVSNIFSMTLTFLFLGAFITLAFYTNSAVKSLERQTLATAFFKDDVPESKILEIKGQFESDERVLSVEYVSKNDAYEIFKEVNKSEPDLLESISPEILPASIQVQSKNLKDLNAISDELTSIDGVEEVKFYKDVVDTFRFWANVIYGVGTALVIMFLIVSYSIIIVTLRTTINSRGVELEILKLVGASDSYVKGPLIFQGMFFGGVSALFAGILLVFGAVLLKYAGLFKEGLLVASLFKLDVILFGLILCGILVLSGIGLGYMGSHTAVKKYLKY